MNLRYTILAASVACALQSSAQSVPTHEMYVDFGYVGLEKMMNVLPTWEPGKASGMASDKGDAYTDDNFFISRVPLKDRFSRPSQQANKDLVAGENAKNLCWWAPIGELTKKWGPLPRWNFDGDNFNMWQYINIHGNWSNSWWRVPGSFNDVAHKNGVRTGCLLFIDWGASVTNTEGNIGKYLFQLSSKSGGKYKYAEKFVEYLRYYGIDGIGFNPEGTWQGTLQTQVKGFLAECHRVAEEKGWPFHVDWYAFVNNSGRLTDSGSALTSDCNTWFMEESTGTPVTDVYMLNYNWSEAGLKTSVETAQAVGGNTFDVYAGFDQQGRGYGRYGNAGWKALMKYPVSICVWGAHDRSQLYTSSTEGGTSDKAIQSEYQTKQELLFTGGTRNVLDRPEITDENVIASYSSLKKWHGYSSAVIEQSTLDELPFVTRFNLGNGAMLNNEGVTTNPHKWYNLGMQDLLPTWRWWVDNGDGKTPAADAIQLDFTFDDAWFGGSCLNVHGATSRSDVRLFETKWSVSSTDDTFSLVYKPATEEGTMQLMVSCEGSENTFKYVDLAPVSGVLAGKWNTVNLKASELGLAAGDVVACVGLSFTNTPANYSTLLGEMSYVPANFSEVPVKPVITHTEVMKRYYNRTDFKVVFDLPFSGTRPAEYEGRPIYNEEVGAWYYEIWLRQGDVETLVATTTSWAHYVVEAPLSGSEDTYQIGVRTVGRDGKTKSDIAWSEELESPLSVIDDITLDKPVIKPNETFTIGFEDPNHQAADIRILDNMSGKEMASVKQALTLTTSLPETGSYDVEVTTANGVDMHRDMILISKEETGRMPEVKSVTAATDKVKAGEAAEFRAEVSKGDTYNGKECSVSRSLYMSSPYQFTVGGDVLGSNEYQQVSYALWFKVQEFSHQSLGTLLMTKVNRNYGGTWTESVWGEMWTAIRPAGYAKNNNIKRDNADNELSVSIHGPRAGTYNYEHNNDVDLLTDGYSLRPNTWYHACVVCNGRNITLYLNGKSVATAISRGADPRYWNGAPFYVGGSMTNLASFTGWIDEVQIWNKALTGDEVREAMNGYAAGQVPDALRGYFTFEEQQTDDEGYICFPNMGKQTAVAGGYMTSRREENNKVIDDKQNQLTTALGTPALTGSFPVVYNGTAWTGDFLVQSSADDRVSLIFRDYGDGLPVTVTATNSWGSASKVLNVDVEEGPVGIQDVETDGLQQPAVTYDLQGRRVQQARNGLYIVNGKKVFGK